MENYEINEEEFKKIEEVKTNKKEFKKTCFTTNFKAKNSCLSCDLDISCERFDCHLDLNEFFVFLPEKSLKIRRF